MDSLKSNVDLSSPLSQIPGFHFDQKWPGVPRDHIQTLVFNGSWELPLETPWTSTDRTHSQGLDWGKKL